jgi:plastocyanin
MAQPINIVRTASGVSFSPAQLTVNKGDPVFWVNMDPQANHQVIQAPGQPAYQYTGPLTKHVPGAEPAASGRVIVQVPIKYALSDDSGVQGSITISTVSV